MGIDVRFKLIVPIFSLACALYGLFHYTKNRPGNMCDMTFMFEYPEYMKIPLKYESAQKFPHYNLFVYGEGKYAEDLRKYSEDLKNKKFQGIPVLFIPGNAGSHRQVRSLASVALRMKHSRQTSLHFNFFSVDLNEEISGLYGGILNDQAQFVYECMKQIQTLYPVKMKMILIGHSMGGVIAKALFSLPDFDTSNVSLIILLGSPVLKPVIAMDSAIVEFYEKIESSWKYRLRNELNAIPIVSIGGGQRDILVRSDLISNAFEFPSPLDIHILTPSIPGVWLSTDHLAFVWCKQLVLTVCRSLYDLIDQKTKQISTDSSLMKNVLRFHFISRSGGTKWSNHPALFLPPLSASSEWITPDKRTWKFSRNKVLSTVFIMIPISSNDNILVLASGLIKSDWIYGCKKSSGDNTKTCNVEENLSENAEIVPSRKNKERKLINLKYNMLKSKEFTHILIHVAPINSQVEMLIETYNENSRTKRYKLPTVFERLFTFSTYRILTISLSEQLAFYNITLSNSGGVLEAVEFQLETRLCQAGSVVGHGFVKMSTSWSTEHSYHHIKTSIGSLTTLPVQVHNLPPSGISPDMNLLFIFDPECSFVLSAKFPLYLIASQFMKFYGIYVIGYAVSILIVFISGQFYEIGSQGMLPSVYDVFGLYPSFLSLVIIPCVLTHFGWLFGPLCSFVPAADKIVYWNSSFLSSLILRSFLYLTACGLVTSIFIFIEMVLVAITTVWMWARKKTLLQATEVPLERTLKVRVRINKALLILSCSLAAVSVGFSSALSSLLVSVFYFFKLSSIHTRCKAEEERRGPNFATRQWYFHFSLMVLCLSVSFLTFPGLVMWVKTIHFSFRVTNDLYVLPCTIIIVSLLFLWQLPTPSVHRYKYKFSGLILNIIALVTSMYGIYSVFRLLYFTAIAFVVICIQQNIAYFKGLDSLKYH